ncbi:gas vesicle synthesis GvpLGvpF [Candidatus Methylomirabilis limnetica]|uniref:Gas vesicle synthesis GvpLGvpF n=1 Tax=Candidatus Methylomirabilis limnetica TaxID=2033718 RepID=A0A2T4TYT4_9BACT|nr:GvpL/GvpF family gas vesicle protein [Candidatus Methylomirabilis limnetica]PTL36259.1 gas vesicle synthesis GvpLGvpF [Candidatus Methylomirabilis limnetica]
MGKYIYCVTDEAREESFGLLGIGGRDDELTAIAYRDIAAIVSDSPVMRYPVSRENSLVHERAIEAVFKCHTVLPARFCTIAENEARVRAILEREYVEFRGLLERMRGKVEVGVKAIFNETLIYQEILERYGEIRRRKEAIAKLPPQQAHWQLVEVGRMVEAALKVEKDRVREEIVEALKGACHDFRLTNRLLGERMIMNAAFLIDRDQEAAFDRRMDELAERYREMVRFKYVGGFPPFNFVNLVIQV